MPHFLVGLILVGLGVWGVVAWWGLFGLVMRGVVPFVLLVFGLLAILSGARRNGSHVGDEFFGEPAEAPAGGADQPGKGTKPN